MYFQQRNSVLLNYGTSWEIYFNGITVNDLKELISLHFNIPQEHLLVAKFVRHNCTWQKIENVPEPVQVEKPTTNTTTKKKSAGNVRAKPFNLRDGDIIAVKNMLEDPENKDDFTAVKVIPKVRVKDDEETTALRKKVSRPEAVLSINLDFE